MFHRPTVTVLGLLDVMSCGEKTDFTFVLGELVTGAWVYLAQNIIVPKADFLSCFQQTT